MDPVEQRGIRPSIERSRPADQIRARTEEHHHSAFAIGARVQSSRYAPAPGFSGKQCSRRSDEPCCSVGTQLSSLRSAVWVAFRIAVEHAFIERGLPYWLLPHFDGPQAPTHTAELGRVADLLVS